MKNAELRTRPLAPAHDPAFGWGAERDRVLGAHGIDSLADDPELGAIARFAAKLCDAPIALVNVVEAERQRFLAHEGLPISETPTVSSSFCVHTMMQSGPLEVRDALADARFAENAFVAGKPHIRFYAGEPLVSEEGVPLGSLCVIDTQSRPGGLAPFQREGLAVLAQAAMRRLRSRRHSTAARQEQQERESYLHILVDSIPAIAWSATPDGHFDYFNNQMVEFTGQPDDQSGSAFHPEDWKIASERWEHSLNTGEPYEVQHRLRRQDGEYRWMISRALPVRDGDGRILRWFGTAVDIHDIYESSESRELLAKELSHRIKNIFAVIAGLVSLSARKHPDAKEFADDLNATIRALGRAHDFVRPGDKARRGTLRGLLEELFAAYGSGDGARIKISGDDIAINARTATPLALVFHELATNSAKYGALANGDGIVSLKIVDGGKTVKLTWREKGGKKIKQPAKEGFGTRLVDMSVNGQLGGTWERHFEDDGLRVELKLPKTTIGA